MSDKKDMSGVLFRNDKGGNDSRPDYTGDITIDGKTWRLAAWLKMSKTNTKYMSLSVSEQREKSQERLPASTQLRVQKAAPKKDDFDLGDDESGVPF